MQRKKTLVTEDGLRKLREELQHLKTVRRREVADAIQQAKDQGDISENAEYVDAKEEQGIVEQRIAELEALLKNIEVIRKDNGNNGDIQVGATVTLGVNGKEASYTIVGPKEADPAKGLISNESPMGMALLGKKPGETVSVRTPAGSQEVRILKIR